MVAADGGLGAGARVGLCVHFHSQGTAGCESHNKLVSWLFLKAHFRCRKRGGRGRRLGNKKVGKRVAYLRLHRLQTKQRDHDRRTYQAMSD